MRGRLRQFEMWLRQVALTPLVIASDPLLFHAAALWRRLLVRTTFVAVTGSLGKTTTTQLLARILASRARTFGTLGNQNSAVLVALNVLRVRPWHRFAVLEVGVARPGQMRKLARTVRPNVALILGVFPTHTTEFADLEQHAAEKAILLESLAPRGLAVLNGDDPRTARMADRARRRVCLFGTSPHFDFWTDHISSRWPDRLRFHVHRGEESREIQTRLLGDHWATPLTAALSVAAEMGVSLEDAARVLLRAEPHAARMEPNRLPSGAIVVRDDYNASIASVEASLHFLRQARAERRLLVITDFSDSGLHRRLRLRSLAEAVAGWLDILVLVGEAQSYGVRRAAEAGMAPEAVHGFPELREAAEFLRMVLRAGDLALLKGRTTDHAARLFLAQCGSLECWRAYCRKTMLCDSCWELGFRPNPGVHIPSIGKRV